MITAYVLINTESIDPVIVAQELTYIEEVQNVHQVTGDYDLIAKIQAENVVVLREDIIKKIDETKGIAKTTSLIVEDQTL